MEAPETDSVVVGGRSLLGRTGRIARGAAQGACVGPRPEVHRAMPADGDSWRSLLRCNMGQPGVDPDDTAARREDVDRCPGVRDRQRSGRRVDRGLRERPTGSPAGRRNAGAAVQQAIPIWWPARPWRARRSRSRGARCGRVPGTGEDKSGVGAEKSASMPKSPAIRSRISLMSSGPTAASNSGEPHQ